MKKTQKDKFAEHRESVQKDKALTVLNYILVSRYFIPILTTAGWIMIFSFRENNFFRISAIILILAGIIPAATVSAAEIFRFIISSGVKFFSVIRRSAPFYIVAEICAGAFGFIFGFMFGIIVAAVFPAVFTINKFFNQ